MPRIADALCSLQVTSITLDGEGVVCGPDGVADFGRLRAAVGRKGSPDGFLYAFDLLELDGEDLRGKPVGEPALTRWQAFYGAAGIRRISTEASSYPSTSMVRMAISCSGTHASSGSRAS